MTQRVAHSAPAAEPCQCGRRHPLIGNVPHIGQKVRIRVHWRYYHRTGTIQNVRAGHAGMTLCDVSLDANDSGPTLVTSMLPSELWGADDEQ